MKSVLIVENNTTPLKENIINNGSKKEYLLGGVFTQFDIMNRNQRIYTADKFLPCLEELNNRINVFGVVYGEFDHPDVFDTSLARASHIIRKAQYVKENNLVEGEIKLLNTIWGKEAQTLVNDGCPVFVSSRSAGVTEKDGNVTIKKLFTYDIVADPGFASAKMTPINESLGFKVNDNTNYRIYEMSDESKINELFNMNRNEFITKQQLNDYSKYIIKELASTKKDVNSAIKNGNVSPKKLEQLLEYYEELNKTNVQMASYLDYLAEKIQIVVNENESLKSTTNKLIAHNDYLAENLEKSINYSEYVAEELDQNIEESVNINEKLDQNVSYSNYLAEKLDQSIVYSEYIIEKLNETITYSNYLAKNLDKSIVYSEYLAESIDGNIAYSEYIAEHLDDSIAYSDHLAENLDKNISYSGLITNKLNGNKLNENKNNLNIPTLEEYGFEDCEGEDCYDNDEEVFINNGVPKPRTKNLVSSNTDDDYEPSDDELNQDTPNVDDFNGEEDEDDMYEGNSDSELSRSVDLLIAETKKRKILESNDLHFLKFLSKSQVDSFYNLTNEEQEQVKLYINEKNYFTNSDVLKLINESLSTKNESLDERLIRLMPENIKPIWSQLNESSRKSILSQAKLYTDLTNETKIEHFWLTRNLKKNESVTKKLISHESLIQEDKLNDGEIKKIMEKFNNL